MDIRDNEGGAHHQEAVIRLVGSGGRGSGGFGGGSGFGDGRDRCGFRNRSGFRRHGDRGRGGRGGLLGIEWSGAKQGGAQTQGDKHLFHSGSPRDDLKGLRQG